MLESVEIVQQKFGCSYAMMIIGGRLISQITHYRASGKTTKKTARGCYDVDIYFNRNVISSRSQRTC
jgi:hypothetical protein